MEADNTNQKVTFLAFAAFAVLTGFVSGILFTTLGSIFAPIANINDLVVVKHGLPLTVGVIVFACLQFNSKVRIWADEVVSEIRKIVWPNQRDTVITTIMVCVMVVVAGIGLAMIDYASSVLIKWIVN